MNIDQAIYILRNTAWLGSNDERDETEQAVEMVIDKLLSAEKAQLSGEDTTKDATYDSISRKDAIDAVEFGITYAKAIDVNTGESKELFKEGNDALKKAVERLKELPSAEPERKTAEWIYGENGGQDGWYCSKCGLFIPWDYEYYGLDNIDFIADFHTCPKCDRKMLKYTGMRGEQE